MKESICKRQIEKRKWEKSIQKYMEWLKREFVRIGKNHLIEIMDMQSTNSIWVYFKLKNFSSIDLFNIDIGEKKIYVFEKYYYAIAKEFGEHFGFEELIKCWEGVADEVA